MNDQSPNAFYDEGFTIDVPKKWTSLFSKRKSRKITFKQPAAFFWDKIANASQTTGFKDFEIEDFEHLTKSQLWQAARIAGLNAGGIFSLFYAAYFYSHLEPEKLGKLAYMVIILNRTEYYSYAYGHLDEIFWANMPDDEKARLAGRGLY